MRISDWSSDVCSSDLLDYSVGWLRHVLGVAEVHRWHHKRDFEDAQVNFGEFSTVWDRLFGTFYDSAGKLGKAEVGLHEKDYPRNYFGQFIDPLRPTSAYPAGHNSLEQDESRNT